MSELHSYQLSNHEHHEEHYKLSNLENHQIHKGKSHIIS